MSPGVVIVLRLVVSLWVVAVAGRWAEPLWRRGAYEARALALCLLLVMATAVVVCLLWIGGWPR